MNNLLQIDGSKGEGGGQILRTSLTMSIVSGTPIQISNIRSKRSKPGLKQQHLTCVQAAQAISHAKVTGAELNSQQITFEPKKIKAGKYHFKINTAGSTTLVMQTVVPALIMTKEESTLHFEGGTHNAWAPSFDFIKQAYLPMLKKMGVDITVKIARYGFYPQGGGQWSMIIKPTSSMQRLEVLDRGKLLTKEAIVSCSKIPEHVPEREIKVLKQHIDWSEEAFKSQWVEALGGGNIISLHLLYENCSEVIDSLGKRGLASHRVAMNAVKSLNQYLASTAPISEHLADQLLLPMVIGNGGVFRTVTPSLHTTTNREIIELFTKKHFQFNEIEKNLWEISL
ncbi:MAG: RNA 3'-terminal phosphate cyclase [Thiotrichaceae bacterium]|nr:RNA 3'-terminal phosphate cyclase [Thiotrichaceae bacterium]